MSWWALIVGVGMILVGLRWCLTRKIKRSLFPLSRESHYITGIPAFSCGVIAIANGIRGYLNEFGVYAGRQMSRPGWLL